MLRLRVVDVSAAVLSGCVIVAAFGLPSLTNRAAAAQSASHQPDVALRPEPPRPIGNVAAIVPKAAVGPTDTAAATLTRGRSYPLVVTVWIAPGSGRAVVRIASSGGRLTDCPWITIGPGVTRLHCTLTTATGTATDVVVGVSAVVADGSAVTRAYLHRLV